MTSSGRLRHRDREPGHRQSDAFEPRQTDRVFKITDEQREIIAGSLRLIDEAREQLEAQQNRANREIIRELRASADRIFDLINELDEIV